MTPGDGGGTTPPPSSYTAPPESSSFYWQLQGAVPTNRTEDVYDVDGFDTTASTFTTLKNAGKYTVAYFSAGSVEEWRPDYQDFPPEVTAGGLAGWEGEAWLDVRRIDILQPLMEARADIAKAKGAQAVEWDNIDVYLQGDSGLTGITAADQIAYVKMLAQITHARGMAAVYKNLPDHAAELEPFFDACIAEEAYQWDEVDPYMVFPANGKPLWVIEYQGTLDCADAAARGIYLAKYPLALNGPPVEACAL